MKHLILGGRRSGKSRYAQECAVSTGKQLVYIATAFAGDNEMENRIKRHQADRTEEWIVLESPLGLDKALSSVNSEQYAVVVDCLTLWMSNALHEQTQQEESEALLTILPTLSCDVFLVSNEVGSGIVPLGELSRKFVDECGRVHQDLAAMCDNVSLVIAGLPLSLKAAKVAVE